MKIAAFNSNTHRNLVLKTILKFTAIAVNFISIINVFKKNHGKPIFLLLEQ